MIQSDAVLLGIDVGTSSVKVVATTLSGHRVAEGHWRYPLMSAAAAAEQDATKWWEGVCAITPGVVGTYRVLGVAVTSQAPTLVALASDGTPVTPALTWLDRRAASEAHRIEAIAPGHRNGPDPFFGTAKLLWLAKEHPLCMRECSVVLSANGFIAKMLTGVSSLDDSTASLMQGFDEVTGQFDRSLSASEVPIQLLPDVVPTTTVIGRVTQESSRATGIPAGTPVAAGAIDSVGTALEAGVLGPGDPFVEMTGFSTVGILAVPAGTTIDGFLHARHCVPGVDLLLNAQVTSGAVVDWLGRLMPGQDLTDSDQLLAKPRPSRLTMVPSLAGERNPSWNPTARGVIDGIDLTTDGYDLMVAAMEGTATSLAIGIDQLVQNGFPVERVLATGGGSASAAWLQIKADVTGLSFLRPRNGHGAAQGASYLAGIAVGAHQRWESIRDFAADIEQTAHPDPERHQRYLARRERYASAARLNAP
ncbi:xylulokinase [Lysinibacter cavernae]|uniref:Xylulokinase n=1 Tax=Lysinibacter cavernae TaxID=1640652 RepID=A0A7X5R3T1_9MICO|nr:FGGY family carbohydrate kinase [Lysinibacter cavernae]NIH55046.1 xylulokinase [Lysinibacter cavernae]